MSKKLREKVDSHEFTITTTKTPAEIQQASLRIAEGEKRTLGSSIKEVNAGPAQISYEVKGPGGVARLMAMALNIHDEGATRKVTFRVGDFKYSRPTMFMIPIGPATAPAMKTLQRFSSRLRTELA